MLVENSLKGFEDALTGLSNSLDELRREVNKQGSLQVQNLIENGDYQKAQKLISSLDTFANMQFTSNALELENYVRTVLKDARGDSSYPIEKEGSFELADFDFSSVEVANDQKADISYNSTTEITEVTDDEKLVLKLIGNKTETSFESLLSEYGSVVTGLINEKSLLRITNDSDNNNKVSLSLSEQGREVYVSHGLNKIQEALVVKSVGQKTKDTFLNDFTAAVTQRNYKVTKTSPKSADITDGNRHWHLVLDYGEYSQMDYQKILNRINQLKSIGFVCFSESVLQNAMQCTKRWAKENPSKCQLLTVNFTTLDRLENDANPFETLKM